MRPKDIKKLDTTNNHFVITGDILDAKRSSETLIRVAQTLGIEKTDLILSRMAGALNEIKKNGSVLDRIIRNWYRMLNENGLMFIQYDYTILDPLVVERWATTIKERFPKKIDIQISEGVLRLHKKQGAPDELPSATELFRTTKETSMY
ncbi:MAG: hypothetical protein Q8O46_02815 [bacterium]|nr:hypothetical protein [bacterium]